MATTRTALVTGASAGIGTAFARHAATNGFDVLLVARREERLRDLAIELEQAHGVRAHVFAADLSDADAPAAIVDHAESNDISIDVLVNNAGISRNTSFGQTPWADLAAELQVMVMAVTELTHRVLPAMTERGWGRIINLSSIAALLPAGSGLLYTAIKRYVFDLSQSLDQDLKPLGVHVTALCPGFTRTEFHDVMGTREAADNLPRFAWGEADDVAAAGWSAVMAGRPVCVPGLVNKAMVSAVRPVPFRLHAPLAKLVNPF